MDYYSGGYGNDDNTQMYMLIGGALVLYWLYTKSQTTENYYSTGGYGYTPSLGSAILSMVNAPKAAPAPPSRAAPAPAPRAAPVPASTTPVDFYTDCNYKGQHISLGVGNYYSLDFNDKLSSLKVPPRTSVTLYEHANMQGKKLTISTGSTWIGIECLNSKGFNDMTSSIQISKI